MGKPKHSDDTRGEQKGAVDRDVTDHGDKAYQARKNDISNGHQGARSGAAGSSAEVHDRTLDNGAPVHDGGHRLFENRTQHDEAEQGSERNRRDRDQQKHHHAADEFQGRDAHEGGVGRPDVVKQTGRGGGNRSDEDRNA